MPEKLISQNAENEEAVIEAVLFAYGEPLSAKKIGNIIGKSENETENAINSLEEKLKNENRGLRLIRAGNEVQLATKPEFSNLLENFAKEEFKENLTPAALETISLIAYLGPISRIKIDYFRGVNSSFILRGLLMRKLIERLEDQKEKGGYLYVLSFDALKHLGISKIEELPEYEKYKQLLIKENA